MKTTLKIILLLLISSLTSHARATINGKLYTVEQLERDTHMERGFRRFIAPLKQIKSYIKKNESTEVIIKSITSTDLRKYIFQLEGLLRLYKKENRIFSETLNKVKTLEDSIGKYMEKIEYLEFAKKIGADNAVITNTARSAELFKNSLKKLLDSEWLQDSRGFTGVDYIATDLASEKCFEKYEKDKDTVVKNFKKHLKSLAENYYDMGNLQGGIHEFRRDIRWISIYIQALQGLIQFLPGVGNSDDESFNRLLTSPINSAPPNNFLVSEEEVSPIFISKPYYLKVAEIILLFGQIKDNGEMTEAIVHSYLEAGLVQSEDDARKIVAYLSDRAGIRNENPYVAASRIYAEALNKRLFEKLLNDFSITD